MNKLEQTVSIVTTLHCTIRIKANRRVSKRRHQNGAISTG